jgi:copper chaperone CopZ
MVRMRDKGKLVGLRQSVPNFRRFPVHRHQTVITSFTWLGACASVGTKRGIMNERENIAGTSTLETHDIGISGMTCDNCVRRVEKALRGVKGVKEVHVNRPAARATVTFDSTQTHIPALHDALLASGYRPSPIPAA